MSRHLTRKSALGFGTMEATGVRSKASINATAKQRHRAGAYSLFEGSCSPNPSFCAANCDRGWQSVRILPWCKSNSMRGILTVKRVVGLAWSQKPLSKPHTLYLRESHQCSQRSAPYQNRGATLSTMWMLVSSFASHLRPFDSQGGPPRKAITCRCRMAFNQNCGKSLGLWHPFTLCWQPHPWKQRARCTGPALPQECPWKIARLLFFFFFFCLKTSNLAHQAPWMSSMMSYAEHVWWLWFRLINYRGLMMAWSRWHPVQFFGCLRYFQITIYRNGTCCWVAPIFRPMCCR